MMMMMAGAVESEECTVSRTYVVLADCQAGQEANLLSCLVSHSRIARS